MKKYTLILALFQFIYASAQNSDRQYNNSQLGSLTKSKGQSNSSASTPIYIIPVVFHILHEYSPEYISDWQVRDAIRILNEDYQKLNPDTYQIVQSFKSIAADCQIEFRLASIDPNGGCTNGIDRIFTPLTNMANDNAKLNPWPNNKYLNIWTAGTLENSAVVGYAHYPGGPNNTDGIMFRHDYIGGIGTSSPQNSRRLTHEIGHYLKIYHLNGTANVPFTCGDDSIADTPVTMGWAGPCDTTGSICNPPIIENVQNFMEYTDCGIMFTAGQAARMHATLNSSVSGRNNLWTPANLAATGTDISPPTCLPKAQFTNPHFVCKGVPVDFRDNSSNVPITSWSWTFPGGIPSSSNDSAPSVKYNSVGSYDAKLVVTNSSGMDSILKITTVIVSDSALHSSPFSEDFESPSSFPGVDGWVESPDSSLLQWNRTNTANSTIGGTHSIMVDNYSNYTNEKDSWVTPSIDFSNVSFPITFSFKISNAQRNSTSHDELKLLYSLNCGQTWTPTSFSKSGSTLATAGIISSSFTPGNPSQWRQENVNVNPVQMKPNVRFKFQNISDIGNNTFIDDINITGNITVIDKTNELQNGFTIYPNPTDLFSEIGFSLSSAAQIRIELKNILGQGLITLSDEKMFSGKHEIKLPEMKEGIYFIVVRVNENYFVRKWVVN